MPTVPTRVCIAAENRLLREALSRLFDGEEDIQVVGQYAHCSEAASQIPRLHPDVFLVNPVSPALADLGGAQEALRKASQLRVVLFGMEEDEKLFFEAVRQGAVGYVLKDANAMDLIAAVRMVTRGAAVCPPGLCLLLFSYVAKRRIPLMPAMNMNVQLGLTRRERELVPMIAEGLTNKEIAAQLNVSEQTVKNHIHRMIQKAGASTRLEIVDRCHVAELVV
jgi:DNA-binding NarL/FixJ family response regulator